MHGTQLNLMVSLRVFMDYLSVAGMMNVLVLPPWEFFISVRFFGWWSIV